MNQVIVLCIIVISAGVMVCVSFCAPEILSDDNEFLDGFVNQEMLAFMGIVVTITLGSAANLFVQLIRIEEKVDRTVFKQTKRHVRTSAFGLIATLIAGVCIVVLKPVIVTGPTGEALFNGAAIMAIVVQVLILIDVTRAVFGLDLRRDD